MEWFKMPADLLIDPVVRQFTHKEFYGWMQALGDAARFETDGLYLYGGKAPAWIEGLIAKGGLIPTKNEEGVECFEVYAWTECIPSKAEMEMKRAETKERVRAYRARNKLQGVTQGVTEGVSNADVPTSNSKSLEVVGSQKQTVTRKKDLAYEALADWWYERDGAWKGLPARARGRLNDALGELNAASQNAGLDMAKEITIRGRRARVWQPEWDWTPQTLVQYWPKLDRERRRATSGKSVDNILALAEKAEGR